MTITTKFNPGDKVFSLSKGSKELIIEAVETVSKSETEIRYVMTDNIFSRYSEESLFSSKQEMLDTAIRMLSE